MESLLEAAQTLVVVPGLAVQEKLVGETLDWPRAVRRADSGERIKCDGGQCDTD